MSVTSRIICRNRPLQGPRPAIQQHGLAGDKAAIVTHYEISHRICIFAPLPPWGVFTPALAQNRDYLTDEEIEMVRDTEEIDKRIDVLIRCIDRRFAVLKIGVDNPANRTKIRISGDRCRQGPIPICLRI